MPAAPLPCLHTGCTTPGTVPTNDGRAACDEHRQDAFDLNARSR